MPASPFAMPASPFVMPASPFVIPAKAGIQGRSLHSRRRVEETFLDSRFRGNDEMADSRLRGNDDEEEVIHAQTTMRLPVGKRQKRHFVRGRNQQPCRPHLAAQDTCRRRVQRSVWRDAAGVVRTAFHDGIGDLARKADQEMEQDVEATAHRKNESIVAGFVAGHYGANAGLRWRSWIPAFAGMTMGKSR